MKEKKIMIKLYDSIDYNNLKFEYVGLAKEVSFYEYKYSQNFLMHQKIIRLNLVR